MALYYFNHDKNKNFIDTYFESLGAIKKRSVNEAESCKANDLIFAHVGENRNAWCKLGGKGVYVIFMSTSPDTLKKDSLSDLVHNCGIPAEQLSGQPQIKEVIRNKTAKEVFEYFRELDRRKFSQQLEDALEKLYGMVRENRSPEEIQEQRDKYNNVLEMTS